MVELTIDSLPRIIGAAGALGTASFGIVEALKWTRLGEAGFGQVGRYLGASLQEALKIAYGKDFEQLLRAQYRQESQQIAKSLRQGVRIGLTSQNAEAIAGFLGTVDPKALKAATVKVESGDKLTDDDRGAIGRFELATDARVQSALARAQDMYLGTVRCVASIFSIALAELAAWLIGNKQPDWFGGLLVGIVAVPLAPIANDLVGALQAATKALRGS